MDSSWISVSTMYSPWISVGTMSPWISVGTMSPWISVGTMNPWISVGTTYHGLSINICWYNVTKVLIHRVLPRNFVLGGGGGGGKLTQPSGVSPGILRLHFHSLHADC